MAFKAGRFNSALQQNRATDTLTLQTIAVLCITGTEAQLFLKLFTASKKGKREKRIGAAQEWTMQII